MEASAEMGRAFLLYTPLRRDYRDKRGVEGKRNG
jgi:hypothetical protein